MLHIPCRVFGVLVLGESVRVRKYAVRYGYVCVSAARTGLLVVGWLAVGSAELVEVAHLVERDHLEHVVRVHDDLRADGQVE